MIGVESINNHKGQVNCVITLQDLFTQDASYKTLPMIVSFKNSINDFYLQFTEGKYKTLLQSIEEYLEKCRFTKKNVLRGKSLKIGSYVCISYQQCMYRGKVQGIIVKGESMLYKVLLIDYGDLIEVSGNKLYSMPGLLMNIEPLAFCASLPLEYNKGKDKTCENLFDELIIVMKFTASIITSDINSINYDPSLCIVQLTSVIDRMNISDEFIDIGLCCTPSKKELPSVSNTEMKSSQTSTSNDFKFVKNNENADNDELSMDSWDPAARHYYAENNRYDVDTEDLIYNEDYVKMKNDESNICKYILHGQRCWKGRECTFSHDLDTNCYVHVHIMKNITFKIGMKILFQVSALETPGKIYVHIPFGDQPFTEYSAQDYQSFNEFRKFQSEYLNNKALVEDSSSVNFRPQDLFPGQLCMAKYKGMYRRSRVLDTTDTKIMVFFIDFGYKAFVKFKRVFEFNKLFANFREYAVRISLVNISPPKPTTTGDLSTQSIPPPSSKCPGINGWTLEQSVQFAKLVNNRFLFGIVVDEIYNENLYLHLLNNDILETMKIKYNCNINKECKLFRRKHCNKHCNESVNIIPG